MKAFLLLAAPKPQPQTPKPLSKAKKVVEIKKQVLKS